MNHWMATLIQTLAAEGIRQDTAEARYVPLQAYCASLAELAGQMHKLSLSPGWQGRHISVFVDGVSKKSTEGRSGQIDAAFQEILKGINLTFDWIDLSVLLDIPSADIHSSDKHLDLIRESLRLKQNNVIVVLGSGSITDLVKHALFLEELPCPLVCIPTALTVTAYTSSFSVIDFHGAKRTLVSREVTAALWVKSFLECAPLRMSKAGYGDLLARFVAYGDWFVGCRLGVMERYNERSFRLMAPFAEGIRENATGFSREPLPPDTTACTAAALSMAGIAMSTAGETTPLSGYEHVISHALDFLRLASGRDLVLHGEQVALGSLISARTIDRLLELTALPGNIWRLESAKESFERLSALIASAPFFGDGETRLSEDERMRRVALPAERLEAARREFTNEYDKKSRRWQETAAMRKDFSAAWDDIKKNLARLTLRAEDMEMLLRQSGLPCKPEETSPPTTAQELIWAMRFSPFIRSRMNIADFVYWMGKDPATILNNSHIHM